MAHLEDSCGLDQAVVDLKQGGNHTDTAAVDVITPSVRPFHILQRLADVSSSGALAIAF